MSPFQSTPGSAQQRRIEKWVQHRLGSLDHERRVKAIAAHLFDLTFSLHGLTRADRRLLLLAAVVHDVGRSIDDRTHPRQGAKLLRNARRLPLGSTERDALIYLTRYHRGAVPGAEQLPAGAGEESGRLGVLLALLRAADGLDSRSIESPRLVMAFHGKRLHITCYLNDLTAKARKVYGRRKKFLLLEELLSCRVEVSLVGACDLQMVA